MPSVEVYSGILSVIVVDAGEVYFGIREQVETVAVPLLAAADSDSSFVDADAFDRSWEAAEVEEQQADKPLAAVVRPDTSS